MTKRGILLGALYVSAMVAWPASCVAAAATKLNPIAVVAFLGLTLYWVVEITRNRTEDIRGDDWQRRSRTERTQLWQDLIPPVTDGDRLRAHPETAGRMFEYAPVVFSNLERSWYGDLADALAAEEWDAADDLTYDKLIEHSGLVHDGVAEHRTIQGFQRGFGWGVPEGRTPSVDIQTMDRLWRSASHERYGWASQATILLRCSSIEDFRTRVGWDGPFRGGSRDVTRTEVLPYDIVSRPRAPVPRGFYPTGLLRIEPWTLPKGERGGRDRSEGLVAILELNGSQVPEQFQIWSPRVSAWDPPRPGSLSYVCSNCGGEIAYGTVYVGDACPHCHATFLQGGTSLPFRPREPEVRR